MRLERLTLQAFRGCPRRLDIVLSGDVVLIYGDNGAGKTTLTEAFEWALFGTVVRKARSKTPGEYRGWSWLRSAHAPETLETFVEVELVDDRGTHHVVRRDLQGRDISLTIDGAPVTDVKALNLRTEDAFRPFLGQCEIQALIDSEQQDRWEQLSSILGFGDFGRARIRLQRLRTDADHDPQVQRVRDLATRAVQPLTPIGQDPLAEDPERLHQRTSKFLGLKPDVSWAEIRAAAQAQLQDLYSRDRRPAGLDRLLLERADLRKNVGDLVGAVELVTAETERHRQWHRDHLRAEFARQGLALQNEQQPSECPYCGERTLTPARIEILKKKADEAGDRPQDSRARVQQAAAVLEAVGPTNADVVAAIIESLPECDERAELVTAAEQQRHLARQQERLRGLTEGFLGATDVARRPDGDAAALENLATQLKETASAIADEAAAIRARVEAANLSLTQRFSSLNDDDRKRVTHLQMAQLLAENAAAVEAAWRVRHLQEQLGRLIAALEAAEKTRMTKALELLSDDIRTYYEELSPGHHIEITGVSVRDSKRRQAALEARSFGKPVNPVTMFSEAEGNCLGLSLYFSQRVDRNPGWRMILLDDPVQSMDAGHEQGLINLLARVSRQRQLVVMTHDRRFAEAFEAQFGLVPSFTRYNLFRASDPEPRVELHAGRLEELLVYAERNAGGDQALRESCAGAVRKAVERFSRDLAAKHTISLKKRMTIEDMINHLHGESPLDDVDAGTLHRLRRFGSRGAHDDASVNATESAVRASAQALRDLQSKYLAPAAPQLTLITGGKDLAAEAS